MCCEREAIVEAYPKTGLVEILVDDDYVERICRVDSNICHHVNANVFLPSAMSPGESRGRAEVAGRTFILNGPGGRRVS